MSFQEADRYDYPLTADDLVINVGGFHGDWAAEFRRRYACRLLIFEPVKAHFDQIVERFRGDPKVEVHHVAIGGFRDTFPVYVAGDSSGRHPREGVPVEEVPCWSATDMIRWTKCRDIGLLELNCESSEFAIIPDLMGNNLTPRIRNLQVQWHFLEPHHEALYRDLRTRLQETHEEMWSAGPVWESWRRK